MIESAAAIPAKVLLLGDRRLRSVSALVEPRADPAFAGELSSLQRALADFRRQHGFGRAIAAPQLGIPKRFIALHLNGPDGVGREWAMLNPRVEWRSAARFSLWDDCMSFPELLVRVERHVSISISFQDDSGTLHRWPRLAPDVSELLQHEIDHLDGILAVDRATGPNPFMDRRRFDAQEHANGLPSVVTEQRHPADCPAN